MTTHPTNSVLICGAGAAGLTLAIELARRGVRFRLIEKKAKPSTALAAKVSSPELRRFSSTWALSTALSRRVESIRPSGNTATTEAMWSRRWSRI